MSSDRFLYYFSDAIIWIYKISEFLKKFGKKLQENQFFVFIFSPQELLFFDKKIYFYFKIGLTLIDSKQIFPMKSSELEISLSVESYNDKNFHKLTEFLRCRKAHSF